MPIPLPSSGFEPENWPALAAKLNADGQLLSPLADGGGRPYIGQLANGFCGTAISPDQFVTAGHVAGAGEITFNGVVFKVVQWTSNGDFAIGRIDGRFPWWAEVLYTDPGYGTRLVAWGFGKGFSTSRLPFVDAERNVFPLDDATYALRHGPARVFRVRGFTYYFYADDDTAAWTGGDSGGPTFWINPKTGKAMLVSVHGGAEQYNASNDYQHAFFGQQQTDASVVSRADWISGQLTPGVSPAPEPAPAPTPTPEPAPEPAPEAAPEPTPEPESQPEPPAVAAPIAMPIPLTNTALKAELQTDPEALGYSGHVAIRNDTSLAALLNAPRVAAQKQGKFISARTLLGVGPIGVSILEKFEGLATAGPDAGTRATAKWTLKFLNVETGIDIGNPVALAMVEALKNAGVFTQPERDLLFGLCTVQISRAEQLFGSALSVSQVSEALNS